MTAMLVLHGKPLRLPCLFSSHGACPGITKPKSCRSFFGGEFGGCLDDSTKWITEDAGIFAVSVVDAPQPRLGFKIEDHVRFHVRSSSEANGAKMYQLHKM